MKKIQCILFILLSSSIFGQKINTLQECIDQTLNNNKLFINEYLSVKSETKNLKYHSLTILPNLSVSNGFNTSFGRRVDPFTNTFATSKVNSQSFGLSSGIVLFNGFNFKHTKELYKLKIQQQENTLKRKQNEMVIRVIETYFNLFKLESQLQLSEVRLKMYVEIQKTQKTLLNEGRLVPLDTLKSFNSILNEKFQNQELLLEQKMKWIEMNFLMGKPLEEKLLVDVNSIYNVQKLPVFTKVFDVEQVKIDQLLNETQLKQQRTSYLPSINLNGNLGTGYSTNNKDYSVSGTPTKTYSDQIQQNLYEGIGIILNVPLFNKGQWFKARDLAELKNETLNEQLKLLLIDKERQKLEIEQQILFNKSKQIQLSEVVQNLENIYKTSLVLYKTGRITYSELETALLDFQQKKVEFEQLKLDGVKLSLINQ